MKWSLSKAQLYLGSIMLSVTALLVFFSPSVSAETLSVKSKSVKERFGEIIQTYKSMMTGRTLRSEDGYAIKFDGALVPTYSAYQMQYTYLFPSGKTASGTESVWTDGEEVYLDQIIDDVVTRRYLASIEGPFQVFRIKPLHPEHSDFITRDCIRENAEAGTTCYIKVRYHRDVIVSTFKEVLTP